MRRATITADDKVRLEAETVVTGRWILEQFAPDLVAMLQAAPDAADLSRLVELVRDGVREIAQDRYTELSQETAAMAQHRRR